MAFKRYCDKCGDPLYFEADVPMPQVCKSCLTGQIECDYPNWRLHVRYHLWIIMH